MFDRYAGDNNTKLEPWQKLYLGADRRILLPSLNLVSFLSAQNTPSAPKRLLDKRKYRETANACLSFVNISPMEIPLLRDDEPIVFGKLDGDRDEKSGVYIHRCVARLKDGIPNPKVRPVVPLPWALDFKVTITPNSEIQEAQVLNLFERGGLALGSGHSGECSGSSLSIDGNNLAGLGLAGLVPEGPGMELHGLDRRGLAAWGKAGIGLEWPCVARRGAAGIGKARLF